MRFAMAVAALLLVAFLTIAAQAAPEVEVEHAPLTWRQATLESGAALYAELCASCHGADATGAGPASAALATSAPDLTDLALRHGGVFPNDDIERVIDGRAEVAAHNEHDMPIWAKELRNLSPDHKLAQREMFAQTRVREPTAYLETLQIKK